MSIICAEKMLCEKSKFTCPLGPPMASLRGLLLAAGAAAVCGGFCSLLGLLLAVGASAVFVTFCCIRKSRSSGAFGASAPVESKGLVILDADLTV